MITRDNAKDWLLLVQAMADGKQLQVFNGKWVDVTAIWPRADAPHHPSAYRIKPEPRRFWINQYASRSERYVHDNLKDAQYASTPRASGSSAVVEIIEVVEVP